MKKLLVIIVIVLLVASIVFVPAILNVSSTIKLKKNKSEAILPPDSNKVSEDLPKNQEENSKQVTKSNNQTDVTFVSLNPLEEIEWLMQNIYVEDLDEDREVALNKDITQIQWENIKNASVMQTLKNILSSIDTLLTEIPSSKVLTPVETAKLRSLIIKYSSSIGFLIKENTSNVSAKESLMMVMNSYNALMQYINNLQISVHIKGLNLDFNIENIKFEKFFENANIKNILTSEDNFLLNSDIYLKRVVVKEVDKKKVLNFDVEVSGKGIKRLEIYNQYGLYESLNLNFPEDKTQTRVLSFNKSYSAKGIYVVKIINSTGKYYYKRYLFYPRITLFTFENGVYKLPFSSNEYKKLDEFFEIKILRQRMNSKFIDREFITSF